jgi:DNA polymerase sigma
MNSQLLYNYCMLCPTYKKLCLILKHWNKYVKDRIGVKKTEGLNSFSICLMLLYFMLNKGAVVSLQDESSKEDKWTWWHMQTDTVNHVDWRYTGFKTATQMEK